MNPTIHHPLSVAQSLEFARDLVAILGETPGDHTATNLTLAQWADELGADRFSQVCMAALSVTFGECLQRLERDDWPEDPIHFTTREDHAHE